MAYGELKVDSITFTNGGTDATVSVSGLVQNPTFSGDITVTGTISGSIVQGGTTVSGATVTGTAGEFGTVTGNTAGFTTVTGTTVTGTTASFTSGVFTNISGGTHTITSGVFDDGTAAAPSITFTGDLDTGIYSPGANQVAISTNGTGRLFVSSAGLVGINQSSPASALDVAGEIRIYPTSGAGNLRFGSGGVEKGKVSIDASSNYTVETAGTERLRITADGKLGLGTSSPSSLLHLQTTSTNVVLQMLENNGSTVYGASLDAFNSSGGNLRIRLHDSGGTYQERFRITSTGNVGIGTTTPSSLLSLGGSVSAQKLLIYESSNQRYGFGIQSSELRMFGDDSAALTFGHVSTTDGTTFSEKARIDANGRLLVGTSSARANFNNSIDTSPIQVEGLFADTSGAAFIHSGANNLPSVLVFAKQRSGAVGGNTIVQNDDFTGFISFEGNDGAQFVRCASIAAYVDGTPGADDMPGRLVFSTTADGSSSPTERMRIDSSGNVGIGTTSPQSILHLAGSSPQLILDPGSGSTDPCSINSWRTNAPIVFKPGDTERVRIDGAGRLLVGTTSSIDVASTAAAIMQVTQGASGLSGAFYSTANAAGPGGVIALGHGRNSTSGLLSANDVMGQIRFAGADGTDMETAGAQISAEVDGTPGANDMPGRLVFSTTESGNPSPTERMRIENSGALKCFTNDTSQFVSARTGAAQAVFSIRTGASDIDGTGGTTVFIVRADGDAENSNGTYTTISDAKFKENVVDAQSQWDDLKAIQIRNFNFTAKTGWSSHKQIGVVAQEVEQVCPNLVKEVDLPDSDETYKTVKTSILYMKAVKALQEAMERIETLEASNADLLARVSVLEQG